MGEHDDDDLRRKGIVMDKIFEKKYDFRWTQRSGCKFRAQIIIEFEDLIVTFKTLFRRQCKYECSIDAEIHFFTKEKFDSI